MRRLLPLLVWATACSDPSAGLSPQIQYSPSQLDFGTVAVNEQRTLRVQMSYSGQGPVQVQDAIVAEDRDSAWQVLSISPVLRTGVQSVLTMVYRPCPAAWVGATVNPSFDLTQCPTQPQTGTVLITTDLGSDALSVRGAPGLAPIAELYCPSEIGTDGCPGPIDRNQPCTRLNYGIIGLGLSCEAELEIINRRRGSVRTGDLLVQSALLTVGNPVSGDTLQGTGAGFEVLTPDAQPLHPSAANPVIISIPDGEDEARFPFKIRYTTRLQGLMIGDRDLARGLKIGTNSPEAPVLRASVYATGVLPQVRLEPFAERVELSPPVGQSEVVRMRIRNLGPGTANVERIRLSPEHPELKIQGTAANLRILEAEQAEFELVYTRNSTSTARAQLLVDLKSPLPTPLLIDVNPDLGSDRCIIEPALLNFGTTQGGEGSAEVTVRAEGPYPCTISELDIQRRGGGPEAEFRIDLPHCQTLPCNPQITLCGPDTADCSTSEMQLPLRYLNQDNSLQDLAELHLLTSQRDARQRVVVLEAADDPCLPPTPVFTVLTSTPCAGQPIELDASQSLAGGRPSSPAGIVGYDWSLGFTPGEADFVPPNTARTQITPESGGLVIIDLDVTNSCGASSEAPTSQQVIVASSCP